jgi:hypothetical protein
MAAVFAVWITASLASLVLWVSGFMAQDGAWTVFAIVSYIGSLTLGTAGAALGFAATFVTKRAPGTRIGLGVLTLVSLIGLILVVGHITGWR